MTNDSLIEKLKAIKCDYHFDKGTRALECQNTHNLAIEEALGIIRQHTAEQPQEVEEPDPKQSAEYRRGWHAAIAAMNMGDSKGE